MKHYLYRLLAISCLFMLILGGLMGVRTIAYRYHSWKLPEETHFLFMGASHIQHGIDDSMMKTGINWARGSERYMFTYIKLERLLAENAQVDTIFLELAPTDLWQHTDYKYHVLNEQSGFVKSYWPFFNVEQWGLYTSEPTQVMGLVVPSILEIKGMNHASWWKDLGGFIPKDGVMDPSQVHPTTNNSAGDWGHEVNYMYLRRIVELCARYKVKLYFLETPTYHPEYFYDVAYCKEAYRKYFSDVEYLDYSEWPIGLDCFSDAHHLNKKGAKKFTEVIIERFGIR